MLLKHRQGGSGGEGNLYVHAARHSVRVLTAGSDETASTPKIVSDVAQGSSKGRPRHETSQGMILQIDQ
ncbi:hypothetical protein V1294_005750 [Bradyrhizobium sp. AZCC 1678]